MSTEGGKRKKKVALSCICRTPENDGSIVHRGKIVGVKRNGEILNVCWNHRRFYKGWKKIR